MQIKQRGEDEHKSEGGYEEEEGVMNVQGYRANEIQFLQ